MKLLSLALIATAATAFAVPALAGQCRDPWVTQAVRQVQGREPSGQGELGECNIMLYGNGRWSSYQDLLAKVQARYPRMQSGGGIAGSALAPSYRPTPGNGAGIVGAGAGNIVGAGAGNIVGAGAGNLVSPGGGSLQRPN